EFLLLDVDVPVFLLQGLQRTIAAYGEEPLGEVSFDRRLFLVVETHESLLGDVTGALQVLDNAQGILEQRALEALKSALDPGGFLLLLRSEHIVFLFGVLRFCAQLIRDRPFAKKNFTEFLSSSADRWVEHGQIPPVNHWNSL